MPHIPPIILLVEPDDKVRPMLKDNLRRWGYGVVVALDEADALQRTNGGGNLFTLILLNQFEQSIDQALDSGRCIRQQAELPGHTPIVILAERYGTELEGQDIQVGETEYVAHLKDGEQLKNLLYQLCPAQRN